MAYRTTARLLLPLSAIGLAASATAYDPIITQKGWEQLAYDQDEECEAEVRSANGKSFLLNAAGLEGNSTANIYIANGDMRPISKTVTTTANGQWAEYYIPFRPNRNGGDVQLSIDTADCSLSLGFSWQRGIVTIQPDGSRTIEPRRDQQGDF
jgi:hypothetical protein